MLPISNSKSNQINQKIRRRLKLRSHGEVELFYLLFMNLPSIAMIKKSFFPNHLLEKNYKAHCQSIRSGRLVPSKVGGLGLQKYSCTRHSREVPW